MIKRPSPYANVSLAAPTTPQVDFGVPNMQFTPMTPLTPSTDGPDTGAGIVGLGASLLNAKKRFGSQGSMIKKALSGTANPMPGNVA